ncbi:hypothetical protein Q5P01_005514 [Channa striata]|uniref:Uncharacterized protein n=1 Tax=Channa striata TaxID=64152 RepID=A0AA88SZK6_CHASR|nr:hypothetical protein Q5P01_005514 [Channa striata]
MKGARAAEVQSLVHVLKCSPRDGPYYSCLLHQQGPGARAGSWPFVSKQMEMGRGEEKWRIRESRGGGGRGGIEWKEDGEGEGREKEVDSYGFPRAASYCSAGGKTPFPNLRINYQPRECRVRRRGVDVSSTGTPRVAFKPGCRELTTSVGLLSEPIDRL